MVLVPARTLAGPRAKCSSIRDDRTTASCCPAAADTRALHAADRSLTAAVVDSRSLVDNTSSVDWAELRALVSLGSLPVCALIRVPAAAGKVHQPLVGSLAGTRADTEVSVAERSHRRRSAVSSSSWLEDERPQPRCWRLDLLVEAERGRVSGYVVRCSPRHLRAAVESRASDLA